MMGVLRIISSGYLPGRAFRVLVTAAFCIAITATPGNTQFDFLFGKPPPPATAKPAEPPANTHVKAKPAKTKPKPKKVPAAKPSPDTKANPSAPDAEAPPPPYDPELLRLAEILGALTYLDDLCAANPPGDWRAKMQVLLEADAKTTARKERLAGSYNRGFRDYETIYHFCTPNAQAIISRFLAEGGRIAHEVVNRYGAS
jgi:uncharacterized protein (TIGR02301 family)